MFKKTKRKGFNFFRSYFDVYNELSDKDKVCFMDALLERQFIGVKPEGLKGMANFAYISQTNSIDSQVKGYEDKTKTTLLTPPTVGVNKKVLTPTVQVQEKEKVQDVPSESIFMLFLKDDYLKDNPQRYDFVRQRMIDTYNAWKLNDWKDGNDKPITNWKVKAINQLRYITK